MGIDDVLQGFGETLFGGGGVGDQGPTLAMGLPALPTAWGAVARALPSVVGAVAQLGDVVELGSELWNQFFGDDSPTAATVPGLPALPAVAAAAGGSARYPKRTPQQCLADPQVIAILQASQEGRMTEAAARAALGPLGCGPTKRRKKRKCPRGMTRAKMCRPKPSSICGRPRRPARRKKCGKCAGACSCRRTRKSTTRRRLTAAQLRAGFGGKRRMR